MREYNKVKNHWKQFEKNLILYLHTTRKVYDNYTGFIMKTMRSFLNWMSNTKGYTIGNFHKYMFVRKEDIPIITLSIEQLKKFMYDLDFTNGLSEHLKKSKDLFVFGCLTGLRFSDLQLLKKTDLLQRDGQFYLSNISQKTGTPVKIKLHPEAWKILQNNKFPGGKLCYNISLGNFNKNLKILAEKAGWTYDINKSRAVRGIQVGMKKSNVMTSNYRFCDLISSHVMRRTAITNLLMLGVSELTVRKISGHSDSSVSFMRYVNLAQTYVDKELDKAYIGLNE